MKKCWKVTKGWSQLFPSRLAQVLLWWALAVAPSCSGILLPALGIDFFRLTSGRQAVSPRMSRQHWPCAEQSKESQWSHRSVSRRKISHVEYETIINDAKKDNPLNFIKKYNRFVKHMNSNRVDVLCISPDGHVLACAWRNGLSPSSGTASSTWKKVYYNNEHPAQALAFSPDGLELTWACVKAMYEFEIWDPDLGTKW